MLVSSVHTHLLRATAAGVLLYGALLTLDAAAQSSGRSAEQSASTLPPQVVTYDPALSSAQADAEEEGAVTITPDDRSTSIQRYGSGGRPTREVVNPPLLPEYSESPPAEPQSVIPDSDPVRGDMVQPPMWTLWSW
ncbi:MAG: hypothetical protein ACKN9C_00040 [Fluviibacter sp.]|jgi:hypothetical protein